MNEPSRATRAPSRGATPLHRLALASLLLAPLASCAKPSVVRPERPAGAQLQLPERDALPDAAREMLHGRMLRHGDQLVYLVTSVLLLDYASTAQLADDLAREPKLGRPAPGEKGTLNALLPAAFFDHQDDLVTHARALGVAARAHDDAALADAFGAVTKTCVRCHAAYLDDDLGFPLHDEHVTTDLCDEDDPACAGVGAKDRSQR